jgi:hypothetical protein
VPCQGAWHQDHNNQSHCAERAGSSSVGISERKKGMGWIRNLGLSILKNKLKDLDQVSDVLPCTIAREECPNHGQSLAIFYAPLSRGHQQMSW